MGDIVLVNTTVVIWDSCPLGLPFLRGAARRENMICVWDLGSCLSICPSIYLHMYLLVYLSGCLSGTVFFAKVWF